MIMQDLFFSDIVFPRKSTVCFLQSEMKAMHDAGQQQQKQQQHVVLPQEIDGEDDDDIQTPHIAEDNDDFDISRIIAELDLTTAALQSELDVPPPDAATAKQKQQNYFQFNPPPPTKPAAAVKKSPGDGNVVVLEASMLLPTWEGGIYIYVLRLLHFLFPCLLLFCAFHNH